MYKEKKIVYIKALTPLHAGAGDGLEIVDMPIQREKHSNIPKIEASSLKGSIKHHLYDKLNCKNDEKIRKDMYSIFGPENGDDHASLIGFTDARLLLFPIKSGTDIFKLITCKYVIQRWIEDLKMTDGEIEEESDFLRFIDVADGQFKDFKGEQQQILEEYVFDIDNTDNEVKDGIKIILENKLKGIDINRVVLLSDKDYIDLVSMYTEIITRNKIDVKTGVAEKTGLFTEEYLPSESVLYFIALGSDSFDEANKKTASEVMDYFNSNVGEVFQAGGDATIGKGFVKLLNHKEVTENE
ncbi:type III-B CRISPR module RAMP protein Cmr4 [Clostridium oryzae]|uniref:RAMP superfamily protein n=1 Tax=Clostridium oryzae TaxID=1450648 RepID=A0A1V4IRX3_9CLOT|nr:type III-B CRISPR module RAMP protein Cmr4 [Clostridium oryzae]OPJ62772.1 RAMP superfamily protein [Clostridium oryzae]